MGRAVGVSLTWLAGAAVPCPARPPPPETPCSAAHSQGGERMEGGKIGSQGGPSPVTYSEDGYGCDWQLQIQIHNVSNKTIQAR